MIQLGIIRITDKVYFEYYELEKPPLSYESGYHLGYRELKLKEYKDSKKSVEVNNAKRYKDADMCTVFVDGKFIEYTKNNQQCKAEITENKATIIELIK